MVERRLPRTVQWLLVLAALARALGLGAPSLRAEDASRISVVEENDSLYFNSDKHYTQGLRLASLGLDLAPHSLWNDIFDGIAGVTPAFDTAPGETLSRRTAIFLGQSIFTPQDLRRRPPDPRDRPYGGWLYVGASLLQQTGRQLENLEIDAGVVGPGAFGKQVQNDFHQLIGVHQALGWSGQIQNEPGIIVSYERLWRLPVIGDGNGVDVVPQTGVTAGNVFTYGDVGLLLRAGRNLAVDYGPARIRPALSGTDWFDADHLDGDLGFYAFIGAQGRAVARNIFLDGNTFRPSAHVDKKALVGDIQAGISLFWSTAFRVDVGAVCRSEEFKGQHAPDVIGTAAAAFPW